MAKLGKAVPAGNRVIWGRFERDIDLSDLKSVNFVSINAAVVVKIIEYIVAAFSSNLAKVLWLEALLPQKYC